MARRFRGSFTGALAGFFSFGFVARRWAISSCRRMPAAGASCCDHGAAGGDAAVVAPRAAGIAALAGKPGAGPPRPRRCWTASKPISDGAAPRWPSPAEPELGSTSRCCCTTRITLMTWIMWLSITFSYYSARPGSTRRSAARPPSPATCCWRRALGLAWPTDGQIMLAGIIMSFFMNGTYAGVMPTPPVFPTAVHSAGWPPSAGWAPSPRPCWWAICIPSLVSWAVRHHHGDAGAGRAGGAGDGVPTRGRSLEAIAAERRNERRASPVRRGGPA